MAGSLPLTVDVEVTPPARWIALADAVTRLLAWHDVARGESPVAETPGASPREAPMDRIRRRVRDYDHALAAVRDALRGIESERRPVFVAVVPPRPELVPELRALCAMVDERDRQRAAYDPARCSLLAEEDALTVEVRWGMLRAAVRAIRAPQVGAFAGGPDAP